MYAEVEDDEDGSSSVAVVARGYAAGVPPLTGRFRMSEFGLARTTPHQSDPAVVTDVTSAPTLTEDEKARYARAGIGAWVGVPLVKDGRFVAALGVHQRAPRDWTPQEITLVEETADRTWDSVERARAEEALRERDEQLALALQAADAGVSSLDLATGTGVTTPQWREVLGFAPPPAPQTFDALLASVHPDDRERWRPCMPTRPRRGRDWTSSSA